MNNNSILRRRFSYKYYNAAFILIGINVLVFIITNISRNMVGLLGMSVVGVIGEGYIWQVVTYMFVHGGLWHIFFNMIPLFFFGVQIERHMGSSEFLLYYLGTGTLAGLFSLLIFYLTGQHLIPLVGASGAIFAVLLAFATYFPNARIFILGIFPMKATTLVLVYGGIELFNTLFVRNTGVAHLTHLAGLGFGYLYFLIREGINPIKVFMDSSRRY